MSFEDSTEGFRRIDPDITVLSVFLRPTWDEIKNGQYSTIGAMLVVFVISLFICIIRILREWWHEIGKHEVLLNLYLTYSGDKLCSTCKMKAGKDSGFVEEHLYTLKVKLPDFVRVQIFNPFVAGYILRDAKCITNPKVDTCLHIHNCGGLRSIEYEMITEEPCHLLCLQSSQYGSVFVQEKERGCVNKREKQQSLFPTFKWPQFMISVGKFLSLFLHDMFPERYFCGGSILITEKGDVRKKVTASPPTPRAS